MRALIVIAILIAADGEGYVKQDSEPGSAAFMMLVDHMLGFNAGLGRKPSLLSYSRARSRSRHVPRMNLKDEEELASTSRQQSGVERTVAEPSRSIRSRLKSLVRAVSRQSNDAVMSATGKKQFPIDLSLLFCIICWYIGHYLYNVKNKLTLNGIARAGVAALPMTIATLQLGIGNLYALFLWLAPDARKKPEITSKDFVKTLPLSAMIGATNAACVFGLGRGSVSFFQIIFSLEPAFMALIGTLIYKTKVSAAKWLTLIPVIGGVCLASLGELNFSPIALVAGVVASVFAALSANENKKLMTTPGLSERLGSVGNQYALTKINAFFLLVPVMLLTEGRRLGQLSTLMNSNPVLRRDLVISGLLLYLANEFATIIIKKTGTVTQSVIGTLKRCLTIVAVALTMGEGLSPMKLTGAAVSIGGVFLYTVIDELVETRRKNKATES